MEPIDVRPRVGKIIEEPQQVGRILSTYHQHRESFRVRTCHTKRFSPKTPYRASLICLKCALALEPDLTRKTTWKEFIKSHWEVLAACDFFSVELLIKGKLVRCMVLFAIDVATRKVEILGIHPQPNGPWMEQIARNVSGEGGFLAGKKYLIHDRDPLYTAKFESILKAAEVEPVTLPPRSPNLNAHAERFVRSVKEERLGHLILFSEEQLRYVLTEYLKYYHHERIHQGINKIIEPQHKGNQGEIICVERLGGLLKSYHRKAA